MPLETTPVDRMTASRRDFMKAALAGTGVAWGATLHVGTATASELPKRNGKPHMKLSLAGYSFSRYLPRSWTKEQLAGAKMTLDDFIHYCAELNLDGCEPTAYFFPRDVTHEYLMHLKGLTFRLGLDISGTAIGNDFGVAEGDSREKQLAYTRRWIDYAAVMGAPVIRIFAGHIPKGDGEEATIERCVTAIDECLDYAAAKGVYLALENHGGITSTAEQMLKIVHGVKPSPWFGVNFDSGNFRTPDPYGDLEKIAPYAVNAQIKVNVFPNGNKQPADLARVIKILKAANYRGYVVLEYEAREEPRQVIPGYVKQLRELIHG